MTDKEKEKIALFRYGIISPLISSLAISTSKKAYLKELGGKEYLNPNGTNVKIDWKTIEGWYYQYLKFGFEGLKPKDRIDKGTTRKLDDEIISIIEYYVNKYPRMPSTSIHEKLIADNIINVGDISSCTIGRYVKKNKRGIRNNTKERI